MTTPEPYTPNGEDVYDVWTSFQCHYADDGYGPRGTKRAAEELDRYIAQVRRDAAREALDGLIEAWGGEDGTDETRSAAEAIRTNYRPQFEETP